MKELIEKQAVIDALLAKMDTIDDKPEVVLGLAIAAGMIKDMPSVTPAEKVGQWKPYDGSWYECSECGAIREAVGYFENFCPNCGTKMSESQTSCSTCILDYTDACTRGAGRAVDDEACEDYLASPTGSEGSDKE